MSQIPINPDIPAVPVLPDCSLIPTAIILITGPRRSGKSHVARQMAGSDVGVFDEDGETDPAAFKRPITARSVVIESAQRLDKTAFLNVLGGMKDRGGKLFVVANVEGLPDVHWLRELAESDVVQHIDLEPQFTADQERFREICKVLNP